MANTTLTIEEQIKIKMALLTTQRDIEELTASNAEKIDITKYNNIVTKLEKLENLTPEEETRQTIILLQCRKYKTNIFNKMKNNQNIEDKEIIKFEKEVK